MAARSSRSAALVKASPLPLLALLCLLLVGCGGNTPTLASAPGSATAPPRGAFPAFSDWRMAYITEDNTLRIVTLDGKKTLTGPILSHTETVPTLHGGLWGDAVIAPDGRAIAYPGGIINLRPDASAQEVEYLAGEGREFSWSPDSTRVVYYGHDSQASYHWYVLSLTDPTPGILPMNQSPDKVEVIGWIDTTHLAISYYNQDQTTLMLAALEWTTGAQRTIATLATNDLAYPTFSLSPDGSELLLTNHLGQGISTSYTPVEELISTSTGQMSGLPAILQTVGSGHRIFAWKPGTQLAFGDSDAGLYYLLDLEHDTATPFAPGAAPLGWAPDTGMIYVCTGESGAPCAPDHFQVSVMAVPPATTMQPAFSIESAEFPFIGLVRSA